MSDAVGRVAQFWFTRFGEKSSLILHLQNSQLQPQTVTWEATVQSNMWRQHFSADPSGSGERINVVESETVLQCDLLQEWPETLASWSKAQLCSQCLGSGAHSVWTVVLTVPGQWCWSAWILSPRLEMTTTKEVNSF